MAKIKFVLVDFAYDESTDGGIQKLKKKNKQKWKLREHLSRKSDWLCRPQNDL